MKKISKESFLPISYGGNIRDIKDAKKLINIGFEKLCFGFGSYNKILFNEISKEIGRQSITLIIDLKKIISMNTLYILKMANMILTLNLQNF